MSKIINVEKDKLFETSIAKIERVESILDIGCGIKIHNEYAKSLLYYCCEPYEGYIGKLKENLEKKTDRAYIIYNYDWKLIVENFEENSVDTIFLLDVIEHLPKNEGEDLLRKTERIAKKQVVIFTPLDYIEQKTVAGKDAWGLDGASWQEHKSVWNPIDFDDSWVCYVSDDFHSVNNVGEELDRKIGAFFAIKTTNKSEEKFQKGEKEIYQALKQYQDKANNYILSLEQSNLSLEQNNRLLQTENEVTKGILNDIYKSRSWKIVKVLRWIKGLFG